MIWLGQILLYHCGRMLDSLIFHNLSPIVNWLDAGNCVSKVFSNKWFYNAVCRLAGERQGTSIHNEMVAIGFSESIR